MLLPLWTLPQLFEIFNNVILVLTVFLITIITIISSGMSDKNCSQSGSTKVCLCFSDAGWPFSVSVFV